MSKTNLCCKFQCSGHTLWRVNERKNERDFKNAGNVLSWI